MIDGVEIDSAVLLNRARVGDEAAFAALYGNAAPVARRVAQRMVHDAHLADDLVQEAFYLVLRAVRSGHGPRDSFKGYLVATVRRLAYRHSSSWIRTVCIDDFGAWEAELANTPDGSPDDLIAAAWATLPPRWRYVLWLIEVDQYSPSELAPAMSLTPGAVSSLATRARRALRSAYLTLQRTYG